MSLKILCLEGVWGVTRRERTSVKPLLAFLHDTMGIEYRFEKTSNRTDFDHYMGLFNRKNSKFNFLYLAFHGSNGKLWLRDKDDDDFKVPLADLMVGNGWKDRMAHFGSCQTLHGNQDNTIKKLSIETEAALITGYKKDVDFFDSSILDISLFNLLHQKGGEPNKHFFNSLKKKHQHLIDELGFVAYAKRGIKKIG